MKIRARWPLFLLLIAVVAMGARWAWRVAGSSTGWTPHLDQWVSIAAGQAGIDQSSLGEWDPQEQATHWLAEVERLDVADVDSQIAMGAAWMLDAPQLKFMWRHVHRRDLPDIPGLPASVQREPDREAIHALIDEFESLCREDCLARIETAVRLDSDDVELRRSRALLAFQSKPFAIELSPRSEDCLSILDACAAADPDNALYDYLAALHLWTSSATYDWAEDGYLLDVENEGGFEQGRVRLAAGLAKPTLEFGTEASAATIAFLEAAGVPRSERLDAVSSRLIDFRASSVLYRLVRWQSVLADVESRAGRLDNAVAEVRKVASISEQISESGNSVGVLGPKLHLRRWSLANLEHRDQGHPGLLSAGDAAQVAADRAEAKMESAVLGEVNDRWEAKANPALAENKQDDKVARAAELLRWAILAISVQMLVVATAALACVALILAALFGKGGDDRRETLGWLRHGIAWLCALDVSFVVLGVFPAEVVSSRVQTMSTTAAIWIGFVAIVFGLLVLFRRRFELPVTQIVALMSVVSVPFVAFLAALVAPDLLVRVTAWLHPAASVVALILLAASCWAVGRALREFARSDRLARRRKVLAVGVLFLFLLIAIPTGIALWEFNRSMETHTWVAPALWPEIRGFPIEPDEFRSALQLDEAKWSWCLIQWQAHRGAVVASIGAVAILLTWQCVRRARRTAGGMRQVLRSDVRREVRRAGLSVSGSCLVASVVFLLTYFGATPTFAELKGNSDQVWFDRMRHPARAWDELAALTAEVRAEPQTMQRLQAEIDAFDRSLAEQEGAMEPLKEVE